MDDHHTVMMTIAMSHSNIYDLYNITYHTVIQPKLKTDLFQHLNFVQMLYNMSCRNCIISKNEAKTKNEWLNL